MANYRVIPYDRSKKHIPVVNIVTVKTPVVKTHVQVKDTGTLAGPCKTVMDSGGNVQGIKTIHIAGYVGPS